jgi:UDP-glucose 4-epimerase
MAKIIITGGLGYIGTELTKLYFNDSNNDVSVIDNSFFSQRVQNLVDAGINYHNVSILDVDKLEPLLHDADIIYHLAGITDVPQVESKSSEEKNLKIHEVGIVGTNNIIKLTNRNSKIIFPSTHVVFEGLNKITKDITEEEAVSANLVYSKVKVQNENDLKKSDLNFTILRLGSVHGLSDDSTRLNIMPNLFSKLSSQKGELRLYGGGVQLKSLVSVKDVARCLKFSGESKKTDRQVYHCTSEHFTVKEVAEICKNKVPKLVIKSSSEDIPNLGYSLSNKKLLDTGFEFKISLSTSIEKMISAWSI